MEVVDLCTRWITPNGGNLVGIIWCMPQWQYYPATHPDHVFQRTQPHAKKKVYPTTKMLNRLSTNGMHGSQRRLELGKDKEMSQVLGLLNGIILECDCIAC